MNREELITHVQRLQAKARQSSGADIFTEVLEFLRIHVGTESSFYTTLQEYSPTGRHYQNMGYGVQHVIAAFLSHVEAGLHQEISPERQAQLDVVSDFLEMANMLLSNKDMHPASAAVLIGATLEEFLRTWIDAKGLSLQGRKPGLETYSQVLRDASLITRQDGKDITSWAGIRNHAAHGEWEEVADGNRIRLMLEGVNLFMRKYGA